MLNFLNFIRNETELQLSNNFKLLGFHIDNKLDELETNERFIEDKIGDIVNFWSKLNLSIHGRLTVYKTYILSQLSYIGTVLEFSSDFTKRIETKALDYVRGVDKISARKSQRDIEYGGLGLVRIKDFTDGLKINMFRRHLKSDDIWSNAITKSRYSELHPFHINFSNAILSENPYSLMICRAFLRAKIKWFNKDKNIMYDNYIHQ